jgi:hypothetical protein
MSFMGAQSRLSKKKHLILRGCLLTWLLVFCGVGSAAPESNVRATKHNLSASSSSSVKASSEQQVCVFCHTPHGATEEPGAPLWNRQLSPSASYTMYSSLSMDATDMSSAPGGSSKLCLSCHDGTLALGSVNVANGNANPTISMLNAGAGGVMPSGSGDGTGFTRKLGQDLSNDHPISFTFDSNLASADGELRDPSSKSYIGDRLPGNHPLIPTENGRVQCTSCHDPHLYDPADPNRKFLRANRLQKATPTGGDFSEANDIICLGCHDKAGQAWAISVHANSTDANEAYTDAAADLREFPRGTKVWQAACLNCHDTHTVEGSRRLLREGTDAAGGITTAKSGGNPAIEETCYQCHRPAGSSVLSTTNNNVPDIMTDFNSLRHMPITNSDQQKVAVHDITDADFTESRLNVGLGNSLNRHVECTDCHNPHRVMKAPLFNAATGGQALGTHDHNASTHTNIASGALKGSVGVEPVYSSAAFEADPIAANAIITFNEKKGVPSAGASTAVASSYVTREYQVCMRCHSNYGFGTNPPNLGDSTGGTPTGTNGLSQYTNQAMEFQGPTDHKGEGTASGWATNNHRSWHPVMEPTGRTTGVRGAAASNWRAPWNQAVGTQTMYCSDCHGNATGSTTVEPSGSNPWGPHGSTNNFILKGPWTAPTSGGINTDELCFRCHSTGYRTGSVNSGFMTDKGEGHEIHADKVRNASPRMNLRCTMCHVALPHGWKNKAFLVNLNDVGPEGGQTEGTNVGGSSYTNGPYYRGSFLRIMNWRQSDTWRENDCGKGNGNDANGRGREWMLATCD